MIYLCIFSFNIYFETNLYIKTAGQTKSDIRHSEQSKVTRCPVVLIERIQQIDLLENQSKCNWRS